jgi:glycosyltransferase involved in cell wall biosynthesis
MSIPRVALICFDNPFLKPMEGGKRGMLSRIRALEGLDIDLEVFLLNKREEGKADLSAVEVKSNVTLHQYPMNPTKPAMLFSKQPICVCKRHVRSLAEDISKKEYDAAIYEGEHVVSYRLAHEVNAKRHILYYHDIESDYRAQLAASQKSALSAFLQNNESKKFRNLEKLLEPLFDEHLFVSCDELEKFDALHHLSGKGRYAPYATDEISASVSRDVVPGRILYVGDLTLDSNYRSLEWFVREAMPEISCTLAPVELRVIGRIPDEQRRTLTNMDSRVSVLGYVDDIAAEYSQAACMISPILYGAGVKVKLIDALAHGQIVVANSKACEGTHLLDGDNLLIGDTPKEFAACCSKVLSNREAYIAYAQNGLDFIREFHSLEAHRRLLSEAIHG